MNVGAANLRPSESIRLLKKWISVLNSTDGNRWIVQMQLTRKDRLGLVIPPTEVGGYLKYGLFGRKARQDLNDPPASAGGISARGDCFAKVGPEPSTDFHRWY